MRSLLDHQADGIEYTLHSHGIEASVVGGNVSPRLIQFHIKLATGIKYNRVAALTDDIALALNVDTCRVSRDGYFVRIEVPRADPVVVRLFTMLETLPAELPEVAPVLGLDENGVPLLVRLASPDIGHMLICGAPGAGKTVLTQAMIGSLALQNAAQHLRLLLIDTGGKAYRHYDGLPNLIGPVVNEAYDAILKLRWLVREMEKRSETGRNTPAIALFVDEVAELARVSAREVSYHLARLTQEGRELGIHVVASTNNPQVVNGLSKNNFGTRIVGYVNNETEARVASGRDDSEADRLMGQGDFLLYSRSTTTRLQAAHITPEEMLLTVEHLGGQPGQSARQAQRRALHSMVEEETGTGRAYRSTGQPAYHDPAAHREADGYPAQSNYTYPERNETPRDIVPLPIRPETRGQEQRKTAESRASYNYDTRPNTYDARDMRDDMDDEMNVPTYLADHRRTARPVADDFEPREEVRPEPTREPIREPAPPRPQPARQEAPPLPPEPPRRAQPGTPPRTIPHQMDMESVIARRSEPTINPNRPRYTPPPQPVRRPPTPAPVRPYGNQQAARAADDYGDTDYGEPDYLQDDSQLAPDERANALPGVNSARQVPIQINVGRSNNPR